MDDEEDARALDRQLDEQQQRIAEQAKRPLIHDSANNTRTDDPHGIVDATTSPVSEAAEGTEDV